MNSSQILTRCLAVSSMRALERASGNKSIAVCKCWSHNGPRGGLRNRLVAGTGNFPTCPSVIWPALSREHRFNRCRSTARYYTSAHSFTSPRRSYATGAPMRASLLAINIPESYKGGGGRGGGKRAAPDRILSGVRLCAFPMDIFHCHCFVGFRSSWNKY